MAERILVADSLSAEMIEAGKELTCVLDSMSWPVSASLWFYFSEKQEWKLLLASTKVAEDGPLQAYGVVQQALRQIQPDKPILDLLDIVVIDTSDPIVSVMSQAVRVPGLNGIRFSKNTINGHSIDDAYIYRLDVNNQRQSVTNQ